MDVDTCPLTIHVGTKHYMSTFIPSMSKEVHVDIPVHISAHLYTSAHTDCRGGNERQDNL